MSKEKNIQVLTSLVPGRFQQALHECISRAYSITKIYSSTHAIEVEQYKEFCAETKKVILTAFNENEESWIYLTPTVDALLEHSLEANNGKELGAYTESSLECNTKVLRLTRLSLSRKTRQIENLTDYINHLWINSDIQVCMSKHFRSGLNIHEIICKTRVILLVGLK